MSVLVVPERPALVVSREMPGARVPRCPLRRLPKSMREYRLRLVREPWLADDPRVGERLGSLQTFQETLVAMPIAGTNFASFTTAKTVIPATCLFPMPANYWQIGKTFRITVRGALNTLVTTPGTCVLSVQLGAIAVYSTGNIQLNATAHTLLPWSLEVLMTVRAVGVTTSANFMGMGVLEGVHFTKTIAATDLWGRVSAADAAVSEVTLNAPVTAPAVGTGFDSTIATTLDFFFGFSISNASNSVTVHLYVVEALN